MPFSEINKNSDVEIGYGSGPGRRNISEPTMQQKEIPEYLDRLHAEIMKNRELQGMLSEKLQPISTSPESAQDIAMSPCETEVGQRLRDMVHTLEETNSYLNSLWNRIQL